ncbi:type VII secretion-associated protein [Mycobacterium sp. DL592]|uniref:type VII secretion-associated protein n=1 Tax=Mycobacterium sp. DL592 TaxID=2675524 RepID=UPI001421C14E|nr:type VII secretion-associated protein [Mycobacterium sp. DL592]
MTVLEVGPATVRQLPPRDGAALDPEMVACALAGIDDTTVLLHERPVAVAALWRHVLSSTAGTRPASLTLVHPTWWPSGRVARIREWAALVTGDVQTVTRSALLGRHQVDAVEVVIEIGADMVAVCRDTSAPEVLDGPADVAAVVATVGAIGTPVIVDAPVGQPHSLELASLILKELRRNSISARVVRIEDTLASAAQQPRGPVIVPASRLPAWAAAATVAIVIGAVGVIAARPTEPATADRMATLVEGRVVVRVPPDWQLTRITAGPGSRRVQLTSPVNPADALHITQSYDPEQTYDAVARSVEHAMSRESPGVFVDFDPDGRTADRRVVSYREARIGREVRWFVVLDGSTRISIGCQSAVGRPETVDSVCEAAVGSAREIGGTE